MPLLWFKWSFWCSCIFLYLVIFCYMWVVRYTGYFDKRSIVRIWLVQAGLVLRDLFLRHFALMWLENLHHLWNSRSNFRFNAVWRRQFVAALIFCRRLAESGVIIMLSVMYMDWLRWWYYHADDLVSSLTAVAFLTTWVRNVTLHHPVQSKSKIGKRQTVLKRH